MKNINSAFRKVKWPVQNVQAFTTTIYNPNTNYNDATYGGFNLGLHVGDATKQVLSHRQQLLDYFPQNTQIQWLNQVHDNNVASVCHFEEDLQADASITSERKLALAIMTADCLPIVLSTLDGQVIAAIHGGWKPLFKGIIENTITKMHVPASTLYAWLGPCISEYQFEVGKAVYESFNDSNNKYESAFKLIINNGGNPKYLANLHEIAHIQLRSLGISHIFSLPDCTYTQKDEYYSYRRQQITGRMATFICRT